MEIYYTSSLILRVYISGVIHVYVSRPNADVCIVTPAFSAYVCEKATFQISPRTRYLKALDHTKIHIYHLTCALFNIFLNRRVRFVRGIHVFSRSTANVCTGIADSCCVQIPTTLPCAFPREHYPHASDHTYTSLRELC